VGERAYAEENARREVDRLVTERLLGKAPGDSVQKRPPAAKPAVPRTTEPDLEVLPASESADVAEFPTAQLIIRKEARSGPLSALISDACDQIMEHSVTISHFRLLIRN
jgi:hypothetical protein